MLLPLGLVALVTTEILSVDIEGRPIAAALLVVASLLLVWRRSWPITVGVCSGVLAFAPPWFGPELDDIATPIPVVAVAIYAMGRWVPDLRGAAFLVIPLVALTADYLFTDERSHNIGDVFFAAAIFFPPYVFGRITRKLAVQADLLVQQQELVRQAAVRDERDRIARELHDVIAHSVSAMVVQVAAARDLVRTDPRRTEQVLDRVAETGRSAISETGRLLHVLRDSDDELGLAPTRGLRHLDELVEQFRHDGLEVDLLVEGIPDDLSDAIDVSAYRVLREALTNALRYSPSRSVRLQVLGTATGLTIRAVNSSEGRTGLGSGLGLAGLTERLGLLGGELRAGPTAAGDFELAATFPLVREPA